MDTRLQNAKTTLQCLAIALCLACLLPNALAQVRGGHIGGSSSGIGGVSGAGALSGSHGTGSSITGTNLGSSLGSSSGTSLGNAGTSSGSGTTSTFQPNHGPTRFASLRYLVVSSFGGTFHAQIGRQPELATFGNDAFWSLGSKESFSSSDSTQFFNYLRNTGLVVHRGADLPDRWVTEIRRRGIAYVRASDHSPNRERADILRAAKLGDAPLRPNRAKIFSMLPQVQGWVSPMLEFWRMGLDFGQRDRWREVNGRLNDFASRQRVRLDVPTKEALIGELTSGSNDVIVLIAHNDGERIYLPGASGITISREEVSRLQRDSAPNRIIVLITCNAGTVNTNAESFAELMLRNKLARTVFASPADVDAQGVPELLENMFAQSRPVRRILQSNGYIQIVVIRMLSHGS